eukprot:RCo037852
MVQRVHSDLQRHALKGVLTDEVDDPVVELGCVTDDLHDVLGQADLSAMGLGLHSGGLVHHVAQIVHSAGGEVNHHLGLPDLQPHSDPQPSPQQRVVIGKYSSARLCVENGLRPVQQKKLLLDAGAAAHRLYGAREGDHEGIPNRLHLVTIEPGQLLADQAVVQPQRDGHLCGEAIPQQGRPLDVREDNCHFPGGRCSQQTPNFPSPSVEDNNSHSQQNQKRTTAKPNCDGNCKVTVAGDFCFDGEARRKPSPRVRRPLWAWQAVQLGGNPVRVHVATRHGSVAHGQHAGAGGNFQRSAKLGAVQGASVPDDSQSHPMDIVGGFERGGSRCWLNGVLVSSSADISGGGHRVDLAPLYRSPCAGGLVEDLQRSDSVPTQLRIVGHANVVHLTKRPGVFQVRQARGPH